MKILVDRSKCFLVGVICGIFIFFEWLLYCQQEKKREKRIFVQNFMGVRNCDSLWYVSLGNSSNNPHGLRVDCYFKKKKMFWSFCSFGLDKHSFHSRVYIHLCVGSCRWNLMFIQPQCFFIVIILMFLCITVTTDYRNVFIYNKAFVRINFSWNP